jgi:hypothetical protein
VIKRTSINSIPKFHKEKEMADFRKYFYALAIVALLACSTVAVNAQTLTCFSLTATNQNIRIEGDAELVGDILLGCQGSGYTTPAGTLVSGADITVSIPSTIITSKVLNPGSTTPISEATVIIDDLKDQTCQANSNQILGGQYITNSGSAAGGGTPAVINAGCAPYWPGSRTHLICTDTTNPGGLGVCQVYAKTSGPQNTYDGLKYTNDGCPVAACSSPNIFAGQPNGTGAVIFRGIPMDPPATGFTRYIRITNIRVNAAQTGLSAGNPLSQLTAIVSFQGPAAVGLTTIQTTVASILTGNGGTKVTADNTFLQCEYPTNDLNSPPSPPGLIQEGPCSNTASSPNSGNGNGYSSVSGFISGTSSGIPGTAVGHGWCTISGTGLTTSIDLVTSASVQNKITWTEGFQTAWKGRNMSEYLGTGGSVIGLCGGGAILGAPCDGGGNNNNVSSTQYYTYNGASAPYLNNPDIAQNSPQIRYFTETGFEEVNAPCTGSTCAFAYNGNAGSADAGTRMQSTISNIPANSVVSVPTYVWLMNGKIVSGVMALVSISSGNAQAPLNTAGAGNIASAVVTPASALASLQNGTTNGQAPPTTGAITNGLCTGNSTSAPTLACTGYVDLTGPTATITYEVIFSDPYSIEKANIYPVVYYPTGELTAKPPVQPQPNLTATVSPYTFAPYIAQPGGNQTTTPLGQNAGTPRFVQTTGTALPLFTVNRCNCSLLFPWVVSDNNYVTGIAVANTSADPTNTSLAVPGYTAVQSSGTVNLYLFGTIKGTTAQTSSSIAAVYPGTDTMALAGSYATFIVNTGFDGYAIAQANFQYCHGLAFLFNATGAVPPVSYLGLVMDFGGLQRTAQLIGDSLGQ